MEIIKKIDIHAHAIAFPEYFPPRPDGANFTSAEELIEMYDRLNIERGVLLPISSPEAQYSVMSTEACKFLVDKYPERFLFFCGVDPRSLTFSANTDLSYLLNHYKKLGARGLGELTANLEADDPMLDNLFAHCASCGLPVTIHIATKRGGMYGIIDELGLPRIEKMLKKHPDLTLLGHSQAFWSEISADNTNETRGRYPTGKVTDGTLARLMREYGNLCCDLSAGSGANAMMRDPEYAARFIEEFADRIFYGCDICSVKNDFPFKFDAFLTEMRESGAISEVNYRKIVRENAIRLLKL